MATIPLTFLSTVPGETKYAPVNKTQARTVLGHGPDTERLLDEAVATGGVQVANGLLLLSGHVAPIARVRRIRSPQISLLWMAAWADGSHAWQYDAVSQATFASRWSGTPAQFMAATTGPVTAFQPTRSPVDIKWNVAATTIPGRLDEVAGDGDARVAWARGRLEAIRAEERRIAEKRAAAERAAAERAAARERWLLRPISPDLTSFLERLRTLTDEEIRSLDTEIYSAYLLPTPDRDARSGVAGGRAAVVRNAAAAFQADRALQSAHPQGVPRAVAKYLRDLASVFAVPESVRRADPRHGALEDLRDPWRRKVLHETSLRDLRWWHVALLVFLGACIAFPPLALVAAIVVGIFALFLLSLALLAWGLGG